MQHPSTCAVKKFENVEDTDTTLREGATVYTPLSGRRMRCKVVFVEGDLCACKPLETRTKAVFYFMFKKADLVLPGTLSRSERAIYREKGRSEAAGLPLSGDTEAGGCQEPGEELPF